MSRLALSPFKIPLPIALVCLTIAVILAWFPQIDIAVSRYFYDPQLGFVHGKAEWVRAVSHVTSFAGAIFVLLCVGWWMLGKMWPLSKPIPTRLMAYFLLVFVIGPVMIVNFGLKENWGRVRPIETTLFDGKGDFTPYYLPTGACESDCSFTSGHSSRGFFFMAVAIAAYGLGWRHRHLILTGAVAFGLLAATLRIIEGKHFLSDVTLSAFIVTYIAWVLYGFLLAPLRPENAKPLN